MKNIFLVEKMFKKMRIGLIFESFLIFSLEHQNALKRIKIVIINEKNGEIETSLL